MKRWLSLVAFLALVVLVSWWGSRFVPGEWYAGLTKPAWNPPNWLFGPVWSALYVMMAIAAWQVWNADHPRRILAIAAFVVQLALNGAWSWLFFGLHRPGVAMADLALLIVLVAVTMGLFFSVRRSAGLLLLPYIAWLGFAWFLNVTLWRLNGGGLNTLLGG